MKYHYFYQSSENKSCDAWIDARDRNEAYSLLRKKGIKPYKLLGRNPVAWRRWAAIAVLACALVATYVWIALKPSPTTPPAPDGFVRHQLYGDIGVIENGIANGWSACGLDEGEAYLAQFAQPGRYVPVGKKSSIIAPLVDKCLERKLETVEGELTEYRQLKQIVESIKSELRQYKANGGTTVTYLSRLQERQRQEAAYYNAAQQELESAKGKMTEDQLTALWAAKNAELRAIGLPMLKEPSED